jgi:DNA-binding transcriptional regulator GbsR (MarR family)
MWRRPFLILDEVVERERLESCCDRLLRQVHLEADAYATALVTAQVSESTDLAQRRLAFAVRALTIWGVARDASPEGGWRRNIFSLPDDPLKEFESLTNRGRALRDQRNAEMAERYLRERAELEGRR